MMQLDFFDSRGNQDPISLEDVFAAYHSCRKNKRLSYAALEFEIDYEKMLIELWEDITSGNYKPSPSTVFLIKKPVLREIFAAQFRDRIVHHLIIDKLEPLFEKFFIFDSYACRKGKGTLFGIKRIERFILRCSENYTKDCFILKLDIKAFFMHIKRDLLWERLQRFITQYYEGNELEALINLSKQIVLNDPTLKCIMRGNISDWRDLPNDKSLFGVNTGMGLPIGNLSSQIFANFFLTPLDHFIKHDLKFKFYGRYVDDFVLIHKDKQKLTDAVTLIRRFLKHQLSLELHPKKIYLQHYTKGVSFLGAFIRPYHTVPGKRVISSVFSKVNTYNRWKKPTTKEEDRKFLSSMNSYLGIIGLQKSYRIRKKIYSILSMRWKKKISLSSGFEKFSLN